MTRSLSDQVAELLDQRLRAYASEPGLLREHYGIEQTVLAGGYGYRQVIELVQNGADAILEAHEEATTTSNENRICVLLRDRWLYVANTGAPISDAGLDALLRAHSSPKRQNQIGRFGVGFKSLLKLGGRIDLISLSRGALRFDPSRCRQELSQRFGVSDAPALRLAWPLYETETQDHVVRELGSWAQTIVRAEISTFETAEQLRAEIRGFPAEFLLFFPLPVTLSMDAGGDSVRELRLQPDGDALILHDGDAESRWLVAKRTVEVRDPRAVSDATHLHARDAVPVAWAVPVDGKRDEAGRFWAFFPTHTPSYLPGILNAPWKLNSDRNAIIGGEWNAALMSEAAKLISESLPRLATPDDPGRALDLFPRQLDRKDDDALPLVEALWKLLLSTPSVPDATGGLRLPSDLYRYPADSQELARLWAEVADDAVLAKVVHPTCMSRQRAARLNALAVRLSASVDDVDDLELQELFDSLRDSNQLEERGELPTLRRASPEAWFAWVASIVPARAINVLRLAEAFSRESRADSWEQARAKLAIIPTASNALTTARNVVFSPDGMSVPGRELIAAGVLADDSARRILTDVMKVQAPGEGVWRQLLSEALVAAAQSTGKDAEARWVSFWAMMRQSPDAIRSSFALTERARIRVRTASGSWADSAAVLLPGGIVGAEDVPECVAIVVDTDFHKTDGPTLTALGIENTPTGAITAPNWLQGSIRQSLNDWLTGCRDLYKSTHQNQASRDYLMPRELQLPRGFSFLPSIRGAPNVRLTTLLLEQLETGKYSGTLKFGHATTASYPKIDVKHPLAWLIHVHGYVALGQSIVPICALAARRALACLHRVPGIANRSDLLGVLAESFPIRFPTPASREKLWAACAQMSTLLERATDEELLELWREAAIEGFVPESLATSQGTIPLQRIFVASSADLARRARSKGRLVVVLDATTLAKWLAKGARDLSATLQVSWKEAVGSSQLLLSVFPELSEIVRAEKRETAPCQLVSGLSLRIDGEQHDVGCLVWQGQLYADMGALQAYSRADRIHALLIEMASVGWLSLSLAEAVQLLGDSRVDALRAVVAAGETLADRLAIAVGRRREPLLKVLGRIGDMPFVVKCNIEELSHLALALLGPGILVALKEALHEEGLKPPTRWNSPDARAFVASIGFPLDYALAPESRREAEESISGPIDLPPLHDFQEEVFSGIQELLSSPRKRRRAVVSLPTGGGKTRVTVEAAVRLVLAPDMGRRCVIWVAQTDELCEQAVQAFRQVWVNVGAQHTDLRIVRLWGGNPNPQIQNLDRPVVIVASIQTLNSRMGGDGLSWLRTPGLVVVDECHHAIAPSYTSLLRWLDAEALRPGEVEKDQPPILGLSATPFRTDDEESHRLARRFDNRWLPDDQERLTHRLRADGVLAEATYEALESGSALLETELEQLASLLKSWEGLEFETLLESINQRLGSDIQRSARLVTFLKKVEERSVLFFANSVSHAEEMAARLTLEGISAAAISGNTSSSSRRYFLDQFQSGDIRVLCNHSVLTTGFDAPRTDMVLIALQVFSPVRYMQMVGRGLRGEKNGGTARCRIVTVMDNLGRFQDRHPYHYCVRNFSSVESKL